MVIVMAKHERHQTLTPATLKQLVAAGIKGVPVGDGLRLNRLSSGRYAWQWPYKSPRTGKSSKASYGLWPEVSPALARERHYDFRRKVRDGVDPNEHRRIARKETLEAAKASGNTLRAVVGAYLKSKRDDVVRRTLDSEQSRLEMHVLPKLGDVPVAELTAGRVMSEVLDPLMELGKRETAKRVLISLRAAIDYALVRENGSLTANVLAHPGLRKQLKKPIVQRHPSLPVTEAANLIRKIDAYPGDSVTRAAAWFMMLLFTRTSEIIKSRWDELETLHGLQCLVIGSVEEDRLKISKKKKEEAAKRIARGERDPYAHVIPLPRQAIEVLKQLQAEVPHGNRYIFFSRLLHGKHISTGTVYQMLQRLGFTGRMSGHGFRRLARTLLHEKGFPADLLEAQLNHAKGEVEEAYNDAKLLHARLEVLQWWADEIDRFRKGGDVDLRPVRSVLPVDSHES